MYSVAPGTDSKGQLQIPPQSPNVRELGYWVSDYITENLFGSCGSLCLVLGVRGKDGGIESGFRSGAVAYLLLAMNFHLSMSQ